MAAAQRIDLEPEDLIDGRIAVHDGNQLEIKLDYTIDPQRKTRYQVETYLFVPRSLGVDPLSYPREQFYSDVHAYIRFKTPVVSLPSLVDDANGDSPLTRLTGLLPRLDENGGKTRPREELGRELRMLACLVRANLRDRVAATQEKITTLGCVTTHAVLVEDVTCAIEALLRDVTRVLERFRSMRPEFMRARQPTWVRELFEYTDEYMSLSVERFLTGLIASLDERDDLRREIPAIRGGVADAIVAEQRQRRGAGYPSVLDGGEHNDAYIYRQGMLKKFHQSVLFLDMSKEREGRRWTHLAAGMAAGVAMLFSTVAAIWSQGVYGINSFAFVVALVIGYIFKDRIKEWLRTYLSSKASQRLYDYNVTIRDPDSDTVLGKCRETFNYLEAADVPSEVFQRRHADATGVLEPDSKPEVVLRYVKNITLRGPRISGIHGRLNDVSDIVRFNVSNFLVRMDDPVRHINAYDPERGEVRQVSCPKRYHLNIVFLLRAANQVASTERVRVILDKSGIHDLIEVP